MSFFNSVGGNVVAQVTGMGDNPSLSELIGPVKVMIFTEGLRRRPSGQAHCGNKFNTMSQVPTITQLLPLRRPEDDDPRSVKLGFTCEPDPKALLDTHASLCESQVYQGVVENGQRSEAARMVAMKPQ